MGLLFEAQGPKIWSLLLLLFISKELDEKWSSIDRSRCSNGMLTSQTASSFTDCAAVQALQAESSRWRREERPDEKDLFGLLAPCLL